MKLFEINGQIKVDCYQYKYDRLFESRNKIILSFVMFQCNFFILYNDIIWNNV
jgi:hypothetical protein